MDTINEAVESFLAREKPCLPRVTLGAVNRDGSLQYAQCFSNDSKETTAVDDVHWIASATKFITTVAVMQCVERGLLQLDMDISTILPEWQKPKVLTGFNEKNEPQFRFAKRTVTLRHLLTHSSGMVYSFMHPIAARYQEIQGSRPLILQTVRESFDLILVFEPGEQWMYGPGLDWAGLMVEHVTGMKLGEYMRENIFEPVSAKDITFHLEDRNDLRARKLKLWERQEEGLKETTKFLWPDPVNDDIGGGGIYTNVPELLKIYLGILQGKILQPDTIKEMFKPHLERCKGLDNRADHCIANRNAIYNAVPDDVPVNHGLGGLLNTTAIQGRRGEGSLTWSGFPNCYWWIDVEKGVAGVYLSQLLPTGDQKSVDLLADFEKAVYSAVS